MNDETKNKGFRLKSVLRHRKRVEENLQKDMRYLLHALAAAEGRLQSLLDAQEQSVRELAVKQAEGASMAEVGLYYSFLGQLALEIQSQRTRVAEVQRQVDTKRMELLKARKERKMLETLREREWRARMEALARREQKFLDEVGQRRALGGGVS